MRMLITGKNGYVSQSLRSWIVMNKPGIEAVCLSVRDGLPDDLSAFDVVVHAAGIAHSKTKSRELYYKVNHGLTSSLARQYKEQGGGHFIYISSMSVYGLDGSLRGRITIGADTPAHPKTDYGASKLLAEKSLLDIEDENLKLSIVRPPIVYGDNCPGNYSLLRRLTRITPVFPDVRNERSMIGIDRLCKTIAEIAEFSIEGMFCPQDAVYHCTSETIRKLAKDEGRGVYLSRLLGKMIACVNIAPVRKVFGSLVYDMNLSDIGS